MGVKNWQDLAYVVYGCPLRKYDGGLAIWLMLGPLLPLAVIGT